MVKFLLQRPIAVLMAFTACFIVGLVTYFTIPGIVVARYCDTGDHHTGVRTEYVGPRTGEYGSQTDPATADAGGCPARYTQ